ncbi:DUF3152 domain-containing protein [Streptomyces sp. NPDC059851]|uniref:DUF3152 domain-containing protein n=1 Tax=Streptomyces sp. NPDC059851 TaxID=3346971 RepID=UPI00365B9B18
MPAGRSTGRSTSRSASRTTTGRGTARRTTAAPAAAADAPRGPRARRRAERRRRLRRTLLASATAVAAVAALWTAWPEQETQTVADRRTAAPRPSEEAGRASRSAGGAHGSPVPGKPSAPSASPSPKQSPSSKAPVPAAGTGVFTASTRSGQPQGKGTARRWRVEVEQGSGVDPNTAAQTVETILGDPRGWIADPTYGFQLVGAGSPVDFTVKIATPTTTDKLCEVVTPELVGETNCRAGHDVVVNLKRWQEGSPQFKGPVEEYRALIVNHEVGHEIGRGHETCPGPGKPAPAMMQQIKGLLGCVANAWPYDQKGTYLSGPPVP